MCSSDLMAFSRVDDLDLNDTIFTHGERLPSFFLICGGAALCYQVTFNPNWIFLGCCDVEVTRQKSVLVGSSDLNPARR